ncbi:hypothetical protein DPMN_045675 [Dreissena polymorpha]|uniref:Uncharacterized protein n=1 Tax=Dreissena polymorpha TaxID=45954 RepID=A0A9D4I1L2_DREPO|nr:hypothetical protein DPMN_045675 [Dreissena polymorpha]
MKVTQGADGYRLPDGPDNVCRSDAAKGIHCSIAGEDYWFFICERSSQTMQTQFCKSVWISTAGTVTRDCLCG